MPRSPLGFLATGRKQFMTRFRDDRRRLLRRGVQLAGAGTALSAWGVPAARDTERSPVVAQIVDISASQIDVSKDFLNGSRAAWKDVNARGAVRARRVQHLVLETDGSPASLRAALVQVRDNAACVALSGSCGSFAAAQLGQLLRSQAFDIAHAAPWLQSMPEQGDAQTFSIFASHQAQIAHALKSLASMGVRSIGAVYASEQERAAHQLDVQRSAAAMQLGVESFHADGNLRALGLSLGPASPALLLFIGGTPELAEFAQGLEEQSRQRYVIALGDVNLQTLLQMGAARRTPVIATQPVPMVNSSLALVRAYRASMARWFDEPPTALSLAGYIAARYTFEVLNSVEGPLNRASALKAFALRSGVDLGGHQVSAQWRKPESHFVTQSMLGRDGRVIG